MQDIAQVTPSELDGWLKNGEVALIDVREVYEHNTFNIGGKLIVLHELMYHVDEIPQTGKVVVYCRKGVRSAIAIQKLQERHGFTNLINLAGGMEAWIKYSNQDTVLRSS